VKAPDGLFAIVDAVDDPLVVERVPEELDRAALAALGHPTVEMDPNGALHIRSNGQQALPQVYQLPKR